MMKLIFFQDKQVTKCQQQMQQMQYWRSFHHPLVLTSALQKQGSSVSFLMGWKGITRCTGTVKEDPQNAVLGQMMTWHLGPETKSCVFLRARLTFTNVRPAIGLSFHASNLGWLTMGFYWAVFKVVISILATWKDAQCRCGKPTRMPETLPVGWYLQFLQLRRI